MRTITKIEGSHRRPHWAIFPRQNGTWYLAFATPTQHGHRFDPGVGSFLSKREAQEAKRRIVAGELDPASLKPLTAVRVALQSKP